MPEVTLRQILDAREKRAQRQQELLRMYRSTIVSFTMNIAGPVKTDPAVERAFLYGLGSLQMQLPPTVILSQEHLVESTGCEALLCVSLPEEEVKALCMQIEEATPLGRLFDMDVISSDGTKLDRLTQRGCIVCGAPGRGCAARRTHSVSELQAATQRIISDHFREADAAHIAALAVQSLIDEVHTTPKPGLVDEHNTGSHRDMTLSTFEESARALKDYFRCCVRIGQDTASLAPAETFPPLRSAGIDAEKDMYSATGGVNTHKGAIFTMGILCGAVGRLWTAGRPAAPADALLRECSRIYAAYEHADFTADQTETAGMRLHRTLGLRGIRGEVADGLPAIRHIGLPAFENALSDGLSRNSAGVVALLHLIAGVDDTNLFHRGGRTGAAYASEYARRVLTMDDPIAAASEMDDAFISKNLSPGGCADLLAAVLFLDSLGRCAFCGAVPT